MKKSGCEVCKGTKGGILGNKNILYGFAICDYCRGAFVNTKNSLQALEKIIKLQKAKEKSDKLDIKYWTN